MPTEKHQAPIVNDMAFRVPVSAVREWSMTASSKDGAAIQLSLRVQMDTLPELLAALSQAAARR